MQVSSAQRLLDQVHSLARLEALEAEPAAYAEQLVAELPAASSIAEIDARDAMLAAVLSGIDALCTRAMRIRLDHALAADTSIAPPTRNVFAQTVVAYVDRVSLLAERARDVAARGGSRAPESIAEAVVTCAQAVFALREALRSGVLSHVRALATAAVSDADQRARDRHLDEKQRKTWSAARRELELVAADPARITTGRFLARLAAMPEQLDEPAPEPERSFADMIEMD